MSRTFSGIMYRTGLTPPTPFLSNAVKCRPGRGWGWPREGNRTVTLSLLVFPLLEGGSAVRFFHFVFFCVWFGVFCRFFAVLLFLGSLFEKFSGANFCFWVSVLVVCFLVLFCLCFCFIIWFSLPKMSRKNSLHVGSCFFWVFFSLPLVFRRRRRLFVFVFSFLIERKLR